MPFRNGLVFICHMTNWNSGTASHLQAFCALYDAGSVVEAARRLGLTQSAVSKQLAHLRERFNDALFVKTSDGMRPTPRAMELHPRIARIIKDLESLDGLTPAIPDQFTGTFRIMATDDILLRLLPDLAKRCRAQTPRMRLTTLPLAEDYGARDLETGRINMVIAVNWHAPEHLRQRLLERDSFACVMHADHPLADTELTIESYCAYDHLLVAPLGHDASFIDQMLREKGFERRVALSVASFGLFSAELLGTDRLATLPSSVARRLADQGDLVLKHPPLALPSIDYRALWHERYQKDVKVGWMLQALKDSVEATSSALSESA